MGFGLTSALSVFSGAGSNTGCLVDTGGARTGAVARNAAFDTVVIVMGGSAAISHIFLSLITIFNTGFIVIQSALTFRGILAGRTQFDAVRLVRTSRWATVNQRPGTNTTWVVRTIGILAATVGVETGANTCGVVSGRFFSLFFTMVALRIAL